MTTLKPCKIRLLNTSYEIKCPEGEIDNLKSAAQKLNEQLLINKKKFKSLNEYQLLLLSSLNISHELIGCLKQQAEQRHHVTELINSLETKINYAPSTPSLFTTETD